MLKRMWRKGNPCILLLGMPIFAATMEKSTEFPEKTKNRISIWASSSNPGYIYGKTKNTNLK